MAGQESETGLTNQHVRWLWGMAFAVTAVFGFGLVPAFAETAYRPEPPYVSIGRRVAGRCLLRT